MVPADVRGPQARPAQRQACHKSGPQQAERKWCLHGPAPLPRTFQPRYNVPAASAPQYDTLQRYRARFGLKSMPATKDELINEVAKHFASAVSGPSPGRQGGTFSLV